VQQVAAPVDLYDNPSNKFVAGFIGTPPMNFFDGKIVYQNGRLVFSADDGFNIAVPECKVASVEKYRDHSITLGIRPEDIGSAAAEQQTDAASILATVEVVEPMGSESYVHFLVGDTRFVSRVDAHQRFEVGQQAQPVVLTTKVAFFDAKTEQIVA